ncbi:DUF5316 domain-containing protein [Brevibacillus centrosporus]|uniref:DUF5316 domain-containing protein n=1 Tax=Brevibacillus centrosporus TaxID=54910 RepID=UPI001143008F|nr:DUF5316 domain-containing protein [Brevibacillus centrosporus]MEC2133332.1 DUF5316 domain-containing protein [Brevibacillus centrosporus]GED33911.1 hypothetical protein BCE02nite_50520 [Brevibacillus centrosporus]
MKRSLMIGFSILFFSIICSLITKNLSIAVVISGITGAISILLSAIFTGSLNSGDRLRANHAIETREDRRTRIKWAINMALIGGPNLLAAILILYFSR